MNPFKSAKFQIYLLQLENYYLARFTRSACHALGRPRDYGRKSIAWSAKLTLVAVLAGIIQFGCAAVLASLVSGLVLKIVIFFVFVYVFLLNFFLFLSLATIIIWPADFVLKWFIIRKAKRKISRFPNLKIVGITGSYGKTTMKEVLATILAEGHAVLKTPENINTPLGVARLILQKLRPQTEIFIVEMGAYQQGDIRTICEITRPDIAILTGINEAHLERFGGIEQTVAAKFEIIRFASPAATVILNTDDLLVQQNYQDFVEKRPVKFYSSSKRQSRDFSIVAAEFAEDGSGWDFELAHKGLNLGRAKVPFLGEYILGTVLGAAEVVLALGSDASQIVSGIKKIRPISHRLEVLSNPNDVVVIDDSYNGNPRGVAEAIRVLSRFKARRKIYITPGLVEMGRQAPRIHEQIGRILGPVADEVILIKNSVTPHIAAGLKTVGFPPAKIHWFNDAAGAHAALPQILRAGDVILFQNDWPANYF